MAELNEQQIELISAYIRQHGVAQDELHDDILDHVCTSIEHLMDGGDSFEKAFEKTIKLFGPGGLKQVQQQTFELLTEMNETMKKVAFAFGLTSAILLLAGTSFKLMHWPGAGVMVVIGSALLVLAYLPMLLWHKLKESPRNETLMHISGFLGLTSTAIGVLFKIMHWPGASVTLITGMAVLGLIYMPIYFYKKYKVSSNKPVTLSTSLVAGTCLILVVALINVKSSSDMNRGLSLISDQLAETNKGFDELNVLYDRLGDDQQAMQIRSRADELVQAIEDLKTHLIAQSEGITEEQASNIEMRYVNSRWIYDIPTHIMFAEDENTLPYSIYAVEDKIRDFKEYVVDVYQPDMQGTIDSMFPIKLDSGYEIDGKKTDWAKYHYYHVPLIGVVSELSNIQVTIRNSEMQALIYMISQSDASDPPSGS